MVMAYAQEDVNNDDLQVSDHKHKGYGYGGYGYEYPSYSYPSYGYYGKGYKGIYILKQILDKQNQLNVCYQIRLRQRIRLLRWLLLSYFDVLMKRLFHYSDASL